jgi:nucleotide-binding universal stress UspA family protein
MFERILVPVDFSDLDRRPLDHALRLATPTAAIVLLSVIDEVCPNPDVFAFQLPWADFHRQLHEEAERRLNALAQEVGASDRVTVRVDRGNPARTIVRIAADESFDLIVMATHGTRGLQHALLGSVTDKVVRHVSCPVLVVRLHGIEPAAARH